MRKTRQAPAVTFLIFLLPAMAVANAGGETRIHTEIPAQRLETALQDLAQQADLQIICRTEAVGDIRTPGISGELTRDEALEKLLEGTHLTYHYIDAKTVSIQPIATTSLSRDGMGPEAEGRLRLAQTTQSGAGETDSDSSHPDVLEEVVVTGSNIQSSLDAEKRAAPVQVIDAEDIGRTGASSLADVLANNPAFMGGERAEQDSGARGFVNLRGLGAQYTLVLLNGRRLSANDPLNAVSIPADAIERVEVLKSGASAVYGSDAVAGVVNVILKSRADGVHATATYGDSTQGGGQSLDANLFGGLASDSARFFFLVNHMTRDEVRARQRGITSSSDMRRFGGYDGRSGIGSPGRIGGITGFPDLIADPTRVPSGSFSLDPADYRPFDPEADLFDENAVGDPSTITGTERTSIVGNFEQDLLDGRVTFFANGFYWQANEENWRAPTAVSFSDPTIGPVPAGNPYNPFGQDVSDVDYRALELGRALMETKADTKRLSGGVRGEIGSWRAEAAVSWFRSNYTVRFHDLFIGSALRDALNRTDDNAFNPFCNACNTPEQYAGLLDTNSLPIDFVTDMADLRLSGPLFDLPTGKVQAAVGGEYRREEVDVGFDPLTASGGFAGWPSFVPYDLERSVRSVFAEVRVPLLPAAEGSSASPLELSLAGRYEDYSDFGSTSTPLATLRYSALDDQVTLRASYAKSFLAPYLEYATADYRSPYSTVLVDPLTNLPIDAAVVVVGTSDIKPETGTTRNLGIILTPHAIPGLTASLDYYRIVQNDLVPGTTNPQGVLSGTERGTVTRGNNIGPRGEDVIVETPFYNLGQRKTSGYELSLRYEFPKIAAGQFDLDLGLARLESFEVAGADGALIDIAGRYDYTSGIYFSSGALPKTRGVLGASWSRGPWSAASQYSFMSSFSDLSPDGEPIGRKVPFYATVDFQVGYEFDATRLTLGVSNAFDRSVPFLNVLNGYDNSENDLVGRFIYARIGVDF